MSTGNLIPHYKCPMEPNERSRMMTSLSASSRVPMMMPLLLLMGVAFSLASPQVVDEDRRQLVQVWRQHVTRHGTIREALLYPKSMEEESTVFDRHGRRRRMTTERKQQEEGEETTVLVDVTMKKTCRDQLPDLADYLRSNGWVNPGPTCYSYMCSGDITTASFEAIASLDCVVGIDVSSPVADQTGHTLLVVGDTTNEGVFSHRVDILRDPSQSLLREEFPEGVQGIQGNSTRVGVLSDSFDEIPTKAGIDIPADQLDELVRIDTNPRFRSDDEVDAPALTLVDEGRAMAELIYDIAPTLRQLRFRTARRSLTSFAENIDTFAAISNIVAIVDDISAPFFGSSIVAKAANSAARDSGKLYFSSAGNNGDQSYQGFFADSGQTIDIDGRTCTFHDFGGGQIYQDATISSFTVFRIQWDDQWTSGAVSDVHVLLFATDGSTVFASLDDKTGSTPLNIFNADTAGNFDLAILSCGSVLPNFVKYIFSGSATVVGASSSTCFGHPNAPFTAGVGALNFNKAPRSTGASSLIGTNAEDYSARGGTPLFFDEDDNRLPEPIYLQQPRFVAADGVATSFFGADDGTGTLRFFGTSAAAPQAAGIAMLMKQVNGALTPLQVYGIMEGTAMDMNTVGFDLSSGHGFLNAERAVEAAFDAIETCSQDIELLGQIGMRDPDFHPLRIQSQDTTTVTVQLRQPWIGSAVSRLYVQYDSGMGPTCNSYQNVMYNADNDNPVLITATCSGLKPVALLNVYVTDSRFDATENQGEVDSCCSPDMTNQPGMHYKYMVWCAPQCSATTT